MEKLPWEGLWSRWVTPYSTPRARSGPGAALRHPLPASRHAVAAVPAFPPLQVMARRAVRLGTGRAMPRTPFGRGDLLRIVAVRASDDLDTVATGPGQRSAAAVLPAAALGTGRRKGHDHAFRCRVIREHTGRIGWLPANDGRPVPVGCRRGRGRCPGRDRTRGRAPMAPRGRRRAPVPPASARAAHGRARRWPCGAGRQASRRHPLPARRGPASGERAVDVGSREAGASNCSTIPRGMPGCGSAVRRLAGYASQSNTNSCRPGECGARRHPAQLEPSPISPPSTAGAVCIGASASSRGACC